MVQKAIKIGFLVQNPKKLADWELLVIKAVLENPRFGPLVIIHPLYSIKKGVFQNLCNVQNVIESFFFKQNLFHNSAVFPMIDEIKRLVISPIQKDKSLYFGKEDLLRIEEQAFDYILRGDFNRIAGDIVNIPKYGIWSLKSASDNQDELSVIGLKEILKKKSFVEIVLERLTANMDSKLVLDRAFFNIHWSFLKTNRDVMSGVSSLILKNLKNQTLAKEIKYEDKTYGSEGISAVGFIKYLLGFYRILMKKAWEKASDEFLGVRRNCFTIFIGNGDVLKADLTTLKPIELPKGVFWADPFLFDYKGERYIFFENYMFEQKKGKISCGKVLNNSIIEVVDVLDLEYHLSYPYVFEEEGKIYLMPESHEQKRLEIYESVDFPLSWKLVTTAFEGEEVVDAHFFTDEQQQKWLFVNKNQRPSLPLENELHIYKVDSIGLNNIEPHRKNPVLIDARSARNAGPIYSRNGKFYRPSQGNVDGVYGKYLNVNELQVLTIEDYEEKLVKIIKPSFTKGIKGTHHLHQLEDMFVIDAVYNKLN